MTCEQCKFNGFCATQFYHGGCGGWMGEPIAEEGAEECEWAAKNYGGVKND